MKIISYFRLRSCFELFEMFFEVKNLHFIPASSVRRHRPLSSLEEAVEPEVFHSQPRKKRSNLKFFTLNPAPEPRAIELVRVAEVGSRGRLS